MILRFYDLEKILIFKLYIYDSGIEKFSRFEFFEGRDEKTRNSNFQALLKLQKNFDNETQKWPK